MEPRVYTCDPRVCTVAVARAIDTRSGRLILEGSFPEMDHPTAGRHRVTGTPVKLSETPERRENLRLKPDVPHGTVQAVGYSPEILKQKGRRMYVLRLLGTRRARQNTRCSTASGRRR